MYNRVIKNFFFLGLLVSFLSISCKEVTILEPEISTGRGSLISTTELKEFSRQELSAMVNAEGYQIPVQHSIKAYKTIYRTIDNNGIEIEASGLILIPQRQGPFAIISAQHGTQIKKSGGAVSQLGESAYEALPGAIFGYVVFMADYLGFGSSENLFHPYHHAGLTASACVDMLRAGKNYCKQNNIQLIDKTFLMGYSEGGYATMAMHKEIEEHYATEFNLTASAPGAGAFNLSETAKYLINSSKISYPGYLPYVLLTYQKYYNLSINLSNLFQEPYASRILSLFDGSKGFEEINPNLTTDSKKLMTTQFIIDFNGNGYNELKDVLTKNNLYNWKPAIPVRLFHGKKDTQVPFFNSQNAYDAMKANGANVELIPCTTGSQDHGESGTYWFMDTMVWFSKFFNTANKNI